MFSVVRFMIAVGFGSILTWISMIHEPWWFLVTSIDLRMLVFRQIPNTLFQLNGVTECIIPRLSEFRIVHKLVTAHVGTSEIVVPDLHFGVVFAISGTNDNRFILDRSDGVGCKVITIPSVTGACGDGKFLCTVGSVPFGRSHLYLFKWQIKQDGAPLTGAAHSAVYKNRCPLKCQVAVGRG